MSRRSPQTMLRAPAYQRPRRPNIARTFTPPDPNTYIVQLHEHDCDCDVCLPYVPSDPDKLSVRDMGLLATLGAVVATAIAFAYDAAGASAALLATIGL